MAKKKIELFVDIENDRDFQNVLYENRNSLICAELYSSAFGSCTAHDRLFTRIKLDWSDGQIVLIKVLVDDIKVFERFKNQSEPVFVFIADNKITNLFRGVDSIRFGDVAKYEIYHFNKKQEGIDIERPFYEFDQPSPDEMEWLRKRKAEKREEESRLAIRRNSRQAARKHHRALRMVPYLQAYNFVLFWPHCLHAHPELYERWDINNIIMVGREEVQLTRELAEDILYAGDAPMNEASLHRLLSGPSLAICFRLLDEEKHFVSLVRKILYEDLPEWDDTKRVEEQIRVTAFDFYKTISPTKEEILQLKEQEKNKRKAEAAEKRARRLSEMQRLARQAIEEALEARKMDKENRKLMLLKSGNLTALEELKAEPETDDVGIVVPEELSQVTSEESSEDEDENEYYPPPGLLIPGLYAPPNDIAKVNGLALLFPKLVSEHVKAQPEFLPPHVLVMLEVSKRYKTIEALWKYRTDIINMGIFKATSPYDSVHVAYSVKQFDTLDTSSLPLDEIKIAYMISITSDRALLELMDLSPVHVSRDAFWGEEECADMFPVDYGDDYPMFEDFDKHIR